MYFVLNDSSPQSRNLTRPTAIKTGRDYGLLSLRNHISNNSYARELSSLFPDLTNFSKGDRTCAELGARSPFNSKLQICAVVHVRRSMIQDHSTHE
jgi:hypothetical protein